MKYRIYTIGICFAVLLLSSCSIFRKKNKCNTCPKWNSIEQLTPENKQNVLVLNDAK